MTNLASQGPAASEDSIMRKKAGNVDNENDVSLSTLLQHNSLLPGQAQFIDAARCNNTSEISTLIKDKNVDVNVANNEGRTPLHWATANGHLEAMDVLIKARADAKAADKYGMNALLLAAWFGHNKALLRLIKLFHNDYNCKNKQGMTILHCACANDQEHIVEFIGECLENFDFEQLDATGKAGLHIAAEKGYCDVLHKLKKFNCNFNLLDTNGETSLLLAAKNNQVDALLTILETDQNLNIDVPDNTGYSAVHWCCELGLEPIFDILAEQPKFNVNFATKTNLYTPLMLAVFNNHEHIVRKIVSITECDLNMQNKNGFTALHLNATAKVENSSITRLLLETRKCDVNIKNSDGQLALHLSCEKGYVLVTQVLVEQGSKLNSKDKFGKNPLSVATRGSEIKIVDLIIRVQRLAQLTDAQYFYKSNFDPSLVPINTDDKNSVLSMATTEMSIKCASEESDGSEFQPDFTLEETHCKSLANNISPLNSNNSRLSQSSIITHKKAVDETLVSARVARPDSVTRLIKNPWIESEKMPSDEKQTTELDTSNNLTNPVDGKKANQTFSITEALLSLFKNFQVQENKENIDSKTCENLVKSADKDTPKKGEDEPLKSFSINAFTNFFNLNKETSQVNSTYDAGSKKNSSTPIEVANKTEITNIESINNHYAEVLDSENLDDNVIEISDGQYVVTQIVDNITSSDLDDNTTQQDMIAQIVDNISASDLDENTTPQDIVDPLPLTMSSEWECRDSVGNLVAKELPTFEDATQKCSISEENLDGHQQYRAISPLEIAMHDVNIMTTSRMQLWRLAKLMGKNDWKRLAKYWQFQDFQVRAIERQQIGSRSYRDHGFRLLVIWFSSHLALKTFETAGKDLQDGFIAIDKKSLANYAKKNFGQEKNKSCTIS